MTTNPSAASADKPQFVRLTEAHRKQVGLTVDGVAITALTGDTVTLDGSASSDPYNTPLSYSWTQTGGTTVSLSGATSAKPTFKSSFTGTFTFQLIVTDQFGRSSTAATTSVVVNSHPGSGGAFGLWLLLPGFALAGLRRRKRS